MESTKSTLWRYRSPDSSETDGTMLFVDPVTEQTAREFQRKYLGVKHLNGWEFWPITRRILQMEHYFYPHQIISRV
tara:strand:+ start:10575 stop:10802 length:228 start_codon:yes stop_codon:yes gene_type:complete